MKRPREVALEVFQMELSGGAIFESALIAAVDAALAQGHRAFTKATRDDILEKAEDMDAMSIEDEQELLGSIVIDGPGALMWYAQLLDETLPYEERLENDGRQATDSDQ